MTTAKSEFYTLSSNDNGDYIPVDLSGARQSVFMVNTSLGNGGFLTRHPQTGSDRMYLSGNMTLPLTTASNDDRLYWVSEAGARAELYVWVIR